LAWHHEAPYDWTMKDALLSPAKELAGLNAASLSGHDWTTFRNRLRGLITGAVAANVTASSDEQIEWLHAARTAHDTVYIADRIRTEALRKRITGERQRTMTHMQPGVYLGFLGEI